MTPLFLQYPACSTCQKAKKWLIENNIEYTNRPIVEEQIALLATNGKLVKRPLVVTDSFVLVGFKPDEWEKLK